MRASLCISGGGPKGAFAVGAIEVLLDRGFEFDVISGTSTGALIAPLVAIGDIAELVCIYTTVRTKDIIRYNWRRLFLDSIYDTKPLERLIRKTMAGDRFRRLQLAAATILLCSVGFQTGRIIYGTQREVSLPTAVPWTDFDSFVRAVLASTNQPMLMPPVFFAGETCFDGGIREVAPLQSVLQLGAERVIVIANSPREPHAVEEPHYRMTTIGPRAIDLMTTEILNNDLVTDADVTVIRPDAPLPTGGMTFEPKQMQEAREIGRRRATEVLG